MAVSPSPRPLDDNDPNNDDTSPAMLHPDEAGEEIPDEGDVNMDSDPDHDHDASDDDEPMELEIINDSAAYFDQHTESLYSIAQHPQHPGRLILTGGGDDVAYLWEVPEPGEVKPASARLVQRFAGHTDSVIAGGWTRDGRCLITAGLDGRVRSWVPKPAPPGGQGQGQYEFVSEAQEVEEVQWLAFHPVQPAFALGASDGSVWVYTAENGGELEVKAAMYNHSAPCTAGAWAPDGGLLVSVSEDGSLYAWDVAAPGGARAVVSLTAADARWAVDGGWTSVAVNWESSAAVCGSASGTLKVVGLPRTIPTTTPAAPRGGGARATPSSNSQAGQILATMATHTASVESLSFSRSLPLLASSSVDGSIVIYDTSRGYSVRRTIPLAHRNPNSLLPPPVPAPAAGPTPDSAAPPPEDDDDNGENTIVQLEFIPSLHPPTGIILTSCGVDGTVKRWDGRSGAELGCWRGHADGVLGFVQTEGRIVTAGDDGVGLVFEVQGGARAVGGGGR